MATYQQAQASAQKASIVGQVGAGTGAAIGTAIFPGVGTAIGGLVGGLAGLFVKRKKVDLPPDPTPLVNQAISSYQDQLQGMIDSVSGRSQELIAAKQRLAAANARASQLEASRRQTLIGLLALGVIGALVLAKKR